ncbi:MAG: fimbrillin family protein [Muribaculaceae bacterium]|nr:fimbrillin family protein [Muribaculaceae bacterium]
MMYPKLKYFYFLSLAVAGMTISSCNSETPDPDDSIIGNVVNFDVYDITRAGETPAIDRFAVFGDRKFRDSDINPNTILFDGTVVEYKAGKWTYQGIQYWYPKHEHSFVAIHPVSILDNGLTRVYDSSKLSLTYGIPTSDGKTIADPADVTDILIATHRRVYDEEDVNTTTTFRFDHIMSKVNLYAALDDNIMSENEYIEFRSIEFSGIKTKCTFNIEPAPRQSNTQTDDRLIEVNGHEADGKLAINFERPVRVSNNHNYVSLFSTDRAVLMLPQAFADNSDAKITLTYTINSNPEVKQGTILLRNLKWEWGKNCSYQFIITRTGIKVESTTISDWDVTTVGNIDAH